MSRESAGESNTYDDNFYFLLMAIIVVILLGSFFALSLDISCTTLWVIMNLIFGYMALSEDKIRKKYVAILKELKNVSVWIYAFMMLALVMIPVLFLSFFYPAHGGSSGRGNPFVSNIVFILSIIPIVPLFAYAETMIFQRYIISGLLRNHRYRCPHCGGMAIGTQRCDLCGFPHTNPIPGGSMMFAVIVSASVFALAHVLLVGSVLAGLTFVGGYVLGNLYIKEGWLPVAATHTLYDYLIIASIIGGMIV